MRLVAAALSTLLFVAAACKSLPPIKWPELAKCGPDVSEIIGAVSEVLLNKKDPIKELENLARLHGTTTVVCAVEQLRSDWTKPGASATPARVTGINNANAVLSHMGTKIEHE